MINSSVGSTPRPDQAKVRYVTTLALGKPLGHSLWREQDLPHHSSRGILVMWLTLCNWDLYSEKCLLPGPERQPLGGSILLKFLLETRLQSKSFDTLDDLLGLRVQKL